MALTEISRSNIGHVQGTRKKKDLVVYQGSDPAAGSEISESVPSGVIWKLVSMLVELVADGTVTSRRPRINIDDASGNLTLRVRGAVQTTANNTTRYVVGPFGDASELNNLNGAAAAIPVPIGLLLGPQFVISTVTEALQAGDNYAAPIFVVEEIVERS